VFGHCLPAELLHLGDIEVQHPDLASPGNEDEAQQNFVKLSTEYDEAKISK
jgi:hypothetical protein